MGRSFQTAAKVGVAILSVVAFGWWWTRDATLRVGPDPDADGLVVILLHGYGAPADDLEGLAVELSELDPAVSFLVPAAPHRVGAGGRAWYRNVRANSKEELEALLSEQRAEAREIVSKHVRKLVENGIPPARIYVGGFSQGAMVAVDLALSDGVGREIGGLLALSGGETKQPLGRLRERAPLRAFVSHGHRDSVVRITHAEKLVAALEEGGHTAVWVPFDGGHQIPAEVRTRLGEFLARR